MANHNILSVVIVALFVCVAKSPGIQKSEQHPIDLALSQCIDKHPSTAGMNACTEKATAAWDAQMNRDYKKLTSAVSAETRKKLVVAQRAWIAFRDSEFGFLDSEYAHASGTMYSTMKLGDKSQIVKARALSIHEYVSLVADISESRGK